MQRRVYVPGLGPRQLRRLRQRLPGIGASLCRGGLQRADVHAVLPGVVVRRRWLWWGMRLSKRDVL